MTEKKSSNRLILVVLVALVVSCIACCGISAFIGVVGDSIDSDSEEESSQTNSIDDQKIVEEEENEGDKEQEAEEVQQPEWYGQAYEIDWSEFGGMDLNYKKINLWPSYDDRSEVLATLENESEATLLDYDEKNDYCEIKSGSKQGWMACGLLLGLPDNMVDAWE